MKKHWQIGILKDRSQPMMGLHALHVAARGLPDVEVAAFCDANPADIERKMAVTRARRHYRDYREMLDREDLDIVVLCSRHPADHLPQIRAAAARGCHVYCEKPMAADLREADEIVRLADEHGIKIAVAHPARYAPAYCTMKAMIEAGEIGRPLTAWGRGKCDRRGGGEDMMVLGTHIIDFEAFLFGAPQRVWADVRTDGRPIVASDRLPTSEPLGPTAGDDVFACFAFANGVRGIFESHRGLPGPADGVVQMGLTVAGTHGALALRFNDAPSPVCTLRISRSPAPLEDGAHFEEVPVVETRTIPGAEPIDYSLLMQQDIPGAPMFLEGGRFAIVDLIHAIETDTQPLSNARTARTTLEMILGVYASSLAKAELDLPLASRAHPLEP